MLVRMHEVAIVDDHAGDAHLPAIAHHMHMGVRGLDRAGHGLESVGPVGNVPDAAVRDDAEAAERLVDVGVDLAPERAEAGPRAVQVLQHHDLRRRAAMGNIVIVGNPELRGVVAADGARELRAYGAGARIADDGRQIRERADQRLDGEAGVQPATGHDLQRVADRGRVEGAQRGKVLFGQLGQGSGLLMEAAVGAANMPRAGGCRKGRGVMKCHGMS